MPRWTGTRKQPSATRGPGRTACKSSRAARVPRLEVRSRAHQRRFGRPTRLDGAILRGGQCAGVAPDGFLGSSTRVRVSPAVGRRCSATCGSGGPGPKTSSQRSSCGRSRCRARDLGRRGPLRRPRDRPTRVRGDSRSAPRDHPRAPRLLPRRPRTLRRASINDLLSPPDPDLTPAWPTPARPQRTTMCSRRAR